VIFSQLQLQHCFNCIALPAADPVKGIGFLFLAQNFTFSIELQECVVAVMAALSSIRIDAQSDDCRNRVLQQLCSTSSLQQMAKLSAQTLLLYDLSLTAVDHSLVARYRMEMTSFCAVLWETCCCCAPLSRTPTWRWLAGRNSLRSSRSACRCCAYPAFKWVVDVTGDSVPGKVNKAIVKAATA